MHFPIGLGLVLLYLLYVFNPFAVLAVFAAVLYGSVHLHYQNEFKRALKHYEDRLTNLQNGEQTPPSTMFEKLFEWFLKMEFEFYQWRNASPTSTS